MTRNSSYMLGRLASVCLALVLWFIFAGPAKAGDTNVFLVTSKLSGTILSNGVRAVDSARIAALLGATNENLALALWVQDFDDSLTGPKPLVELVVFNRATTNVVSRLLTFNLQLAGNMSLYQLDRSVVALASGEAAGGLVNANVDALITYQRTSQGPRNFKVQPLGSIFYASTVATNSLIIHGGGVQGQGTPIRIP